MIPPHAAGCGLLLDTAGVVVGRVTVEGVHVTWCPGRQLL